MNSPGTPPQHATSIFEIPCPDCGIPLTPVAESDYVCPGCGCTYRANLGYLMPTGSAVDRRS